MTKAQRAVACRGVHPYAASCWQLTAQGEEALRTQEC